jgi:hypothetical protein
VVVGTALFALALVPGFGLAQQDQGGGLPERKNEQERERGADS